MARHEESVPDPAASPVTPIDRAFVAIVRALEAEDPRFVRRLSRPAPGGLGTGHVMVLVGFLATVVFGIVPLALGLQTGLTVLLVLGAIGSAVLPLVVPLVVRRVVRRFRPMMG